jgi:hypothetical protein
MLRRTITTLAVIAATSPCAVVAQQGAPELHITLERHSQAERATADQLRTTLQKYDVTRWVYTRRIHIDERAIPHSHPVLTLHTRHVGDEHALLATFLHEQLHWLEDGNEHFRAAMDSYAQAYPDAPPRGPEGARDLESTYRHLLVCDLEFQAMSLLVGSKRARDLLSANRHYTWIYDRVLNDPKVRDIATTHGFVLGGEGHSSRGIIKR